MQGTGGFMKLITMFALCFTCLSANAMTRYADGSIMLSPEEVANVEKNFKEMQQTILEAIEVIEMQEERVKSLEVGGKCI
jgi:hypothetical protein